MDNILSMSLDDVKDVIFTPKHKQQNTRIINRDDHYLVDDYGVTLLVTEELPEASAVYTKIEGSREKAIIHVLNGKQLIIETNAPLIYLGRMR